MTQTEQIILLIWILGIVFNLLMVKKIFPDELDDNKGGDIFDIFLVFFMLPIIFLQYMLKAFFVMGSWVSWIAVGIMFIIEKIEEWGNSNIKKRTE
jgi:hypothetical protein